MMIVGFSLKRLILLITFPKIPNLHLNKTSPFRRHWETFSGLLLQTMEEMSFPAARCRRRPALTVPTQNSES